MLTRQIAALKIDQRRAVLIIALNWT